MRTLNLFLHFVKDKVEQLVVSLEHARHCSAQRVGPFVRQLCGERKERKGLHAFAAAGELDSDARVGVLGEVEDRLALGLVECRLRTLWTAVATTAA